MDDSRSRLPTDERSGTPGQRCSAGPGEKWFRPRTMTEMERAGLRARTDGDAPLAEKPAVAHMTDDTRARIEAMRRRALNDIDEATNLLNETRAAGYAEALNDVLDVLDGENDA